MPGPSTPHRPPVPPLRRVVRDVAASGARVAAAGAVIVLALAPLPDEHPSQAAGLATLGVFFATALAAFTWVLHWELRRVHRSRRPARSWMEAVAVVAVLFVAIFAKAYTIVSVSDPSAFSEPMDRFDSYYYALSVLATLGLGDIAPLTRVARGVTMLQMVMDLVLLGLVVRLLSDAGRTAADRRRSRHRTDRPDGADGPPQPGGTGPPDG